MKYAIYDNNGKTVDRYTLRIPYKHDQYRYTWNYYWGFNENPYYPLGFGQYAGEYPMERSYKHLGKKITIESLPKQAREFVNNILKDLSK